MASALRPGAAPVDACELLVNARPVRGGAGVLRREGTFKPISALNSGAQFWGATEYVKADGTRYAAMFVGDKFYTAPISSGTIGSATQRATSLSTAWWSIVQMRVGSANYLIAANGGSSIYYWDGTSWGTLTGAPSGVKYLATFGDRLYVAGHNANVIQGSAVADPNTWSSPDGVTIQATTHDGDTVITGLFPIQNILLIFKAHSIAYVEGFGPRTLTVESGSRGISRSVGCIAPRSIQAAGDAGVCFLSERGIEFLAPEGLPELVSGPVSDVLARLRWTQIQTTDPGLPTSLWWPEEGEYQLAVPIGGSQTSNNYIVHYRPPAGGAPAAIWLSRRGTLDATTYAEDTVSPTYTQATTEIAALWMMEQGDNAKSMPAYGGFDGLARQFSDLTPVDDATSSGGSSGSTVEARYLSRPMLYREVSRRKRARAIRLTPFWAASSSAGSLSATVKARAYVDGVAGTEQTLTKTLGSGPPDRIHRLKALVSGRGVDLRVHARWTGLNVGLLAAEMQAEPLRERP